MPGFIFRPTRRELDANLRASARGSTQRGVRGVTRTTEEAYEVQRRLQRETGEQFTRPYAVSGNAPESRQAEAETMRHAGISHDAIEQYFHAQGGKEAARDAVKNLRH